MVTESKDAVRCPTHYTDLNPSLVRGWTVLPVGGEVDVLTAPALKQAIAAQLEINDALILDMSTVTFLDSSGIAVLVETTETIRSIDGRLKLIVNTPQVMKVLQLTGLDQVLDITVRLDSATAAPPTAES